MVTSRQVVGVGLRGPPKDGMRPGDSFAATHSGGAVDAASGSMSSMPAADGSAGAAADFWGLRSAPAAAASADADRHLQPGADAPPEQPGSTFSSGSNGSSSNGSGASGRSFWVDDRWQSLSHSP